MTDPYRILHGDALTLLRHLPDESVNCIVTSPPYWGLRDYGVDGQLGLEATPQEYVAKMVEIFAECGRVLRKDGTCWVNMGDTYASAWSCGRRSVVGQASCDPRRRACRVSKSKRIPRGSGRYGGGNASAPDLKEKDLCGIPWRVAFALQDDGWYLRQDIIWSKPNPMPESVRDRPTKAHEYFFLFSKSAKYWYDAEAIRTAFAESTAPRMRRANSGRKSHAPGQTPHTGCVGPRNAVPTGWDTEIGSRHGAIHKEGRTDKQRGHSRKHAGFNARRDHMEHAGQLKNGANAKSVWTIATRPYSGAHFATFPPELARRAIVAGCPIGGIVLDPFLGSGTTIAVALENGRRGLGIELNPEYIRLAYDRIIKTLEKLEGRK